jgi:MscS family membrane protein
MSRLVMRSEQTTRRRVLARGLLAVLVLVACRVIAIAQEPPPEPTATATPAGPADEFHRGVPRSAVQGYLQSCWDGEFKRAANYLDLRRVPRAAREKQGPALAQELCAVIDRTLLIDPEELSGAEEGLTDDGLPPRRDLLGTIQTEDGPVDLLLERTPRDDGVLIWKISSATVAKIPQLFEEFSYGPIAEHLPAAFHEIRFLQLPLFQWLGLLVLLLLVTGASWAIAGLLVGALRMVVSRTRVGIDVQAVKRIGGPLRLVTGVLLFYAGTSLFGFSVRARALVAGGTQLLVIAAFTWVGLRVVDVIARSMEQRYRGPRWQVASLAPLLRRTAKAFVLLIVVLATVQNFGFNVTSLLAGVGIGGLAVALAAQKTVEHLFGGVTLITDQPVRVGDFCRFGDNLGTVEDIGLRSTRVRTLERTVITIPNGEFSSMQIENFSRRDRIWLHTTLGLRYETSPDQLRFILVEIKKLLLGHSKVDPDPARVRFVGFGASSLDLEIFAYVMTADINEFLAIREDLFLRMMEVIAASGSGFAFPSQTAYFARDGGLDADKTRAAEEQVRAWRAANELCLPNFPPDRAAALRGQIAYPPPGAARG